MMGSVMRKRTYASLRDWYDTTRKHHGNDYTQAEAADYLEMSQAYFSMLLAGKRQLGTTKAKQVAARTRVPVEILLNLGKAA
jgi:transcriptional regulator with XRE-family HTH domain